LEDRLVSCRDAVVRRSGQHQAALKRSFEGKRVILKIDMPATKAGVDVWPGRDMPVDFPRVTKGIKANGTAITAGENQMVTEVPLVKNHIEFHPGGGGYAIRSCRSCSSPRAKN
jgi:hypothetical protein